MVVAMAVQKSDAFISRSSLKTDVMANSTALIDLLKAEVTVLCLREAIRQQAPPFMSCSFCTTAAERQSFHLYNNTDTLYVYNNTNALAVYVASETTEVGKAESYCSRGDLDRKTRA